MAEHDAVADHYSHGGLLDAILAGMRDIGKTPETITVDDLALVDEFHIGGRQASEEFIGQLDLSSDDHVLDVGCGLAGTSRFVASTCGCRVCGIDLTPEFIATARALCSWVGLADRIELHEGSALATPFEASTFDAAFMLHVGMNIEDKAGLFAEVWRVLRPGGVFGVYDVMRTSDDPLAYPVPWAAVADASALATPQEYRRALGDSGFEITNERDRREFATEFFDALRKRIEAAAGPPPLGTHIVMGANAAIKVRNMVENVAAGRISPVEIIARKAA
jgi:ubiquinone/menaquinone biosynthesis C-methylase UbiE